MNINASYYTSRGNRGSNEDCLSLMENEDTLLAIVADGLGGHSGGEQAARIAIKTINREISCDMGSPERVEDAVRLANSIIRERQAGEQSMRTTVSLLCVSGSSAVAANVGDSRLYQFRNHMIAFQSVDHSVSQMAALVGEITAGEIRTHRDRNKLVRALGSQDDVRVDVQSIACERGDAFLLCSDGFWEHVLEGEMLEDLARSRSTGEWLAQMRKRVEARIRANGDNHSAIAIFLN